MTFYFYLSHLLDGRLENFGQTWLRLFKLGNHNKIFNVLSLYFQGTQSEHLLKHQKRSQH